MHRIKEALFGGNNEGGFLRRQPKELELVKFHLPSLPQESTAAQLLLTFRSQRGPEPIAEAEVIKEISGKWVPLPDDEIEHKIREFAAEIAALDNPFLPTHATKGIDVVVFEPSVSRAQYQWRMRISSEVEDRLGAGRFVFDKQQREWFSAQNPRREVNVRNVHIRQRIPAG